MTKEGYSRPGLFGTMNHYDNRGHKVGHSRPGLFGSVGQVTINWTDFLRSYNL